MWNVRERVKVDLGVSPWKDRVVTGENRASVQEENRASSREKVNVGAC